MQRILVTGANRGIGAAIVRELLKRGAKVYATARRPELIDIPDVEVLRLDITDQASVDAAAQLADDVDVLINNAAVHEDALADTPIPRARRLLHTNVLGYIACAREALDRMRPRKHGHLVNVGSMSADLREPNNPIYVATKAAIQAFSESLRKSANKQNIRVTLIEPGAVATPIQEKTPEQEREKLQKMEMILPEDIARCIVYCLTQPQRVDVVSVQIRPIKQAI